MLDPIGTLRWIKNRVDMIFNLSTAQLTLQETGGTITSVAPGAGAEVDIYRVEAPMGSFEPLAVQVDMTINAAADTIVFRTYYRVAGGGNRILEDEFTVAGVADPELKTIDLKPNRHGIQVTMEATAGAGGKDYDYCVLFRS